MRQPSPIRSALFAFLAPMALLLSACAEEPEPEPGMTTDRDINGIAPEFDQAYDTFSRAYAEADVQLLMDSVYAPDAFYLPPDSPILSGQDQFRGQFSFLERFTRTGQPGPDIQFEIVDRDVSGDLAYDIGTFTLRSPLTPHEEPTRGTFIVVWKKNPQGQWRIHADSFSPLR